ncbi:MAG: hypothetical protein ACLQO6_15570 [Desulfomonilaceae bacterium]
MTVCCNDVTCPAATLITDRISEERKSRKKHLSKFGTFVACSFAVSSSLRIPDETWIETGCGDVAIPQAARRAFQGPGNRHKRRFGMVFMIDWPAKVNYSPPIA